MSRITGFIAKYSGRCGICDETIKAGDESCFVDDEICHADCAEEEGHEVKWD